MTWTVGFDLDMTLIDSRRGVARAIDVVAAEFGLELRGAELAERLGPPLGMILADGGAPEELIPELVGRYRELYPDVVAEVPAMDGAEAAVEAVVGAGGRVVVVTGKYQPHAELHIEHLGWPVDLVVGELWSEGKAVALREQGARVFVGDHAGDMRGARAAGAYGVGVVTGPCSAEELEAAGAEVVLADLTGFPAWWAGFDGARGSARRCAHTRP
ncbi:HAD family hydrolase [Nocardia cyriacigeorgica]|uniref:Putative hydrolase n=2 Tax=Nocardia cyriacigeorgica TaxID=135487 RepID=H6RDC0_NOCCG|nr:HAD hydrolase-like protein [Nocardia cyriacigeorgica]MBF6080385.1 HAD family hydrolase [Nocardia cyriacigeorgica]MBF6286299.1 HAD family hydrolase [Nocardia cyriacigeorgica]MBF6423218.1 HAD family hydrolase [Nocardia cyriacigeorgica]CCF63968.1 Putative hydrolase [Nocardia cyriacigeorgica GUH-2]BDT87620.1 hydrolase [Nocardia cyriacigeorgica]